MRLHLLLLALIVPHAAASEGVVSCDSDEGRVCVEVVEGAKGITVYGINRHAHLPVTLDVAMQTTNLDASKETTPRIVLTGDTRQKLGSWTQPSPGVWSYEYTFEWTAGDHRARHDPGAVYRLPFPDGASFEVVQGCHGDFSHLDNARYSVDFGLTIGEPVLAARAGRIVFVKEDSNRGGPDPAYLTEGNFVSILHEDGSIARYYHLVQDGVVPELGDRVDQGDLIGYAGNTGFSTGPHLHFEVIVAESGAAFHTVPVTFTTTSGLTTCPNEGTRLRAPN